MLILPILKNVSLLYHFFAVLSMISTYFYEWITSQLKEPIVPLKHLSFRWWVFRSVAIYKKKKSLIKMPFGTSIRLWTLLAERINVPICKEKRPDTFCIKPMLFLWWELRGSNSRPSVRQTDALPAELNSHNVFAKLVPAIGIEPTTYWLRFSCSTSWAMPAFLSALLSYSIFALFSSILLKFVILSFIIG